MKFFLAEGEILWRLNAKPLGYHYGAVHVRYKFSQEKYYS